MKYLLIMTYSFDTDCQILQFETEDLARKALQKYAEEEYRTETEENGWYAEIKHEENWYYAEVTSDGNTCYYHVASLVA